MSSLPCEILYYEHQDLRCQCSCYMFQYTTFATILDFLQGYRYTLRPLPLAKRVVSQDPSALAIEDAAPTSAPSLEKQDQADKIEEKISVETKIFESKVEIPGRDMTDMTEVKPHLRLIAGQAVGIGGRAIPSLFPPFAPVRTSSFFDSTLFGPPFTLSA